MYDRMTFDTTSPIVPARIYIGRNTYRNIEEWLDKKDVWDERVERMKNA